MDGQKAPVRLVGDAMVAVELTEGSHTVTFVYRNGAFLLGLAATLGSSALLFALWLLIYKPKLKIKHGKFEK